MVYLWTHRFLTLKASMSLRNKTTCIASAALLLNLRLHLGSLWWIKPPTLVLCLREWCPIHRGMIETTTCSILSLVSGFCRLCRCRLCQRWFRRFFLFIYFSLANCCGTQRIQNWLFWRPWERYSCKRTLT